LEAQRLGSGAYGKKVLCDGVNRWGQKAYIAYIEYWNSKLEDLEKMKSEAIP
jgi:hypothetical protein